MVDFLRIIDYSKEIRDDPRLKDHLEKVAKELSVQHRNDENYRQPVNDTNLSNIVILTGLPKVPQEKAEKLQGFFKAAILPKLELPEAQFNLEIVKGESTGIGLATFNDQEVAKAAAEKLNGFQFDKNHVLSASTNEDFDDVLNLPNDYTPPKVLTKEELQGWLLDHRFREQLLVRAQNKHYLQWFDHVSKVEPILPGVTFNQFGEVNKVEWSKSGSYLVTFHEAGFGLWGGNNLEQLNFFHHPEVRNVEFTSDEQYVLSFNGTITDAPNSENYIVWKVGTIQKLRSFKAGQSETWGSYKWSHDGKFIASMGNDILNVYELPSMMRVEDPQTKKRSALKVANIQNISWSPNRNILVVAAYKSTVSTKGGDNNGKVYVLEFPSRQNIKWKTITWEFTSCEIYWENTGAKVILVLKKSLKNKKHSFVVQVGDIKFNNIIVEEMEFTDAKFVNVDETGKKVSIASQDPNQRDAQGSGLIGYTVDLYKTDEEVRGKYFQKLGTFTDKYISHVMWSPNGVFFALVNIDKFSAKIGTLEFGFMKGNSLEIIKATKFSYMISSAWDPSGRYLVTSSTKGQYTIWTAYGDAVIKDNFNEISQIQWRPKPRPPVTPEAEAQLAANVKKYIKKYEEEDDRIINEDKYKKEKVRTEQKEAFIKLLNAKKKLWEDTKAERVRLLGFDEDNMSDLVLDEIIEGEEVQGGK